MKILNWIKNLFQDTNYSTRIERYVASKMPNSVAEVEYWTKVYEQANRDWVL